MRKTLSKIIFSLAVLSMLANQQASAQAAPVANFVMNRAVAGIVTRVAVGRGFAANDPRIAATLAGISSTSTALNVASTVAGVAVSIAGAPVWLSVAAGLGVLAAGYGIYAYSGGSSINLGISNGKLQVQAPPPTNAPYSSPSLDPGYANQGWLKFVAMGHKIYRTSACMANDPLCAGLPPLPSPLPNFSYQAGSVAVGAATLSELAAWQRSMIEDGQCVSPSCSLQNVIFYWTPSADGNSFRLTRYVSKTVDGQVVSSSDFADFVTVGAGVRPIASNDLQAVANSMTDQVKGAKLDETTLANIVDQAWKKAAAQPGYTGLPYSVSEPIEDFEVQPWIDANPSSVPTIGDLLTPASNANSQTVPIGISVSPSNGGGTTPVPGEASNVNVVNTPNVNVMNKVQIDFGSAPTIAPPNTDAPTALSILSPLLNLMPDLKAYTVPAHIGECPRPTIDVYDWHLRFDSMCDLAEQQREPLFKVMMALWAVAALYTFLRA